MKKYAIIGLLVLIIGAFVLVPLFQASGEDEIAFADFERDEDIQTTFGAAIPLKILVPDGIEKIELIYNDSIFNTWQQPAKKIDFLLDASFFGVGTRVVVVRSYLSDGTTQDASHMIRVVSDIAPIPMLVKVSKEYPHNTLNYTQGLEFNNRKLYEATGDPRQQGKTVVGQIDLKSGAFTALKNGLDQTYFGEGITLFGDELFQLTWKNGKCFVYDKNTMMLKREISYTGDGWGLCNDGKLLIMSDGTERIYFRNPKTFQIVRTIDVYDNVGPRTNINELEYINGKIYANIYQTNTIIAIDPFAGKVMEEIDASALEISGKSGGDVLNGIAYNPLTKQTLLTGKYWSKLFDVQFIPVK
jgi:glutamine cyclotransferase